MGVFFRKDFCLFSPYSVYLYQITEKMKRLNLFLFILFCIYPFISGYGFFDKNVHLLTMQDGLADIQYPLYIRIRMDLCGSVLIMV